jgi:adenylate cyclase
MPDDAPVVQRWLAELRRRKVFRVAVVYVVVAWLLIQIADTTFEPMGLPGWTIRLVITLAVLGFPLACALAWAFDVTPRGIERTAPVAEPGLPKATLGAATATPAPTEATSAPAPADSVAILPFVDMSPARDQEYFCDGIAEEIINSLCCIRDLRIASRTSSFQYKGRAVDVRDIGRALGVSAVLEGSVRKAGERVRITAQLVKSADGYHLWSESFDRSLDDVFAIQSEIAQKLVSALRLSLSRQECELIERHGTRNAEAYDLYLRGQAYLRDGTDSTLPKAVAAFRRAIEHDPGFAQAHAGLASAHAIRGLWRQDVTSEDFDEAFRASARAFELQPRMPEALVARATLLSMQGRATEAAQSFDEAIRLSPGSFEAHYFYARHCFGNGETEKSLPLYEAAVRLRPEDYPARCMLAGALEKLNSPDFAEANERAMQAIERHLELEPEDGRALHLGAVQAAKQGDVAKAEAFAERALAARPNEFATLYNLACAYAVLGRHERALDLLDRAVRHGRGNLAWIEQDPDFGKLRGDPRFEAIVDRLREQSGEPTA